MWLINMWYPDFLSTFKHTRLNWGEKEIFLNIYMYMYIDFIYLLLKFSEKQRVRILNVIKSLSLNKNLLFI